MNFTTDVPCETTFLGTLEPLAADLRLLGTLVAHVDGCVNEADFEIHQDCTRR